MYIMEESGLSHVQLDLNALCKPCRYARWIGQHDNMWCIQLVMSQVTTYRCPQFEREAGADD